MTPSNNFYVGYLPLPPRHARFLRLALPMLFVALLILAVSIAAAQRDPGAGVWDTANQREWTGVLHAMPYPVLIDEDDQSALLIVEATKQGPRPVLEASAGHRATLKGWLIERDGRRMIELAPQEDAVNIGEITDAPLKLVLGAEVTLTGEILDSKCYLGSMKPGDGKTHKACATLCIQGGIPPMLVVLQSDGTRSYYLLTAPDGTFAKDLVLPFIGEPVTLRGQVSTLGDLNLLVIRGPILRL